ncbi:ECF transporter S component [Alicyclobacillus tolerans]|uniref:ECF transporter S component n=1 Tax=Alicyclobacillus tolerans TaxID=90970 RepID=UPI001F3E224E|nr:ECF transporter S component [Alicyclobacillus tolerans]MCF8564032.1 ECF transporter S component [Alicyclobacillus tolerans]
MWKLRDIVVLVILSIVCGIIFRVWDVVSPFLTLTWVPGQALINGVWFIAGMLIPYIIRRPGAALLAEFIAALIELALASNWGWGGVLSGILQGLGAEIGFLLFAYKRYNLASMLAAGALSGLGFFPQWYLAYGGDHYSASIVLLYGILNLISGAILGGLLAKWIGDALNRTGVVRNFEIGRQTRAAGKVAGQ